MTIRDNQNHPIGSSDGGLGVSNVRQQYCRTCVSVKMDLKFTKQDLKIAGYALAIFFGIGILASIPNLLRSLTEIELPTLNNISAEASPVYLIAIAASYLVSLFGIWLGRKTWINVQVKKSAKNKFYMPKAPHSTKFYAGWFTVIFAVLNLVVLSLGTGT